MEHPRAREAADAQAEVRIARCLGREPPELLHARCRVTCVRTRQQIRVDPGRWTSASKSTPYARSASFIGARVTARTVGLFSIRGHPSW